MVLKLKSIGLMVLRHGSLPVVVLMMMGGAWAGTPLKWSKDVMEVNRYSVAREGEVRGKIRQQLAGVLGSDGEQLLKAGYELSTDMVTGTGQEALGRMSMEVIFDPETFDLISRTDNFSAGDEAGRVLYTRTPTGVQVQSAGEAEGIPREPEEWSFSYDVNGPLVDQTILVYYIRSVPLEKGRTFDITTVNPSREGMEELKGQVREPKNIVWNGSQIQVYPIDTATASGVTTYYVRPDAGHTLVRYTSATARCTSFFLPRRSRRANNHTGRMLESRARSGSGTCGRTSDPGSQAP